MVTADCARGTRRQSLVAADDAATTHRGALRGALVALVLLLQSPHIVAVHIVPRVAKLRSPARC